METAIVSSNNSVNFKINGVSYSVSDNFPPNTSLLVYIREYAKLRGTKAMCYEGGCGACIVNVTFTNKSIAMNSCLVPVLICEGWNIYTIEGIGNKRDGYHPIQAMLANQNGSQCGYCSPGMVMNLYSLWIKKDLSMQQIENSFDGNICRCTGYRAILDAFKRFATDASSSMMKDIRDIEELYKIKLCPKYGMPCTGSCYDKQPSDRNTMLSIKLEDARFYKVYSINDLFMIFDKYSNATYILNGGNTAHGVYRSSRKDLYIDINNIPDLRNIEMFGESLVLGGNVTLTMAIEAFQKYSTNTGFKYLSQLAKHVEMIANVPVRNIGSIAGNLMIKHEHNEFPSDLFLILQTVGAKIKIYDKHYQLFEFWEFLDLDMRHKIIYSIVLSPLSDKHVYRFYKIMPRAQNARAHVNAGFLFKLDGNYKVLERPNIIFGGINQRFLHAKYTQELLMNTSIMEKEVLNAVLDTLYNELQPDHVLPDYSPEFRRILATGLFYKFVLSIKPEIIQPKFRSGGTLLERGLSSGSQDYDTNIDTWPVSKPMPKLEACEQTSGEVHYCNDVGPYHKEVFCAFVLTKFGNGELYQVDPSLALNTKGVIAFFSAKDIPGKNLCIYCASKLMSLPENELLFAEKNISYAGQPVGVIVAETHDLANEATQLVKITYKSSNKKPVISIEDALATQDNTRIVQSVNIPAKKRGHDTQYEIRSEFHCGTQYHYPIETQSCVCVPVEDGMNVYPSSQWMDLIQVSIANCLNIQNDSINVYVGHLGGSYGSKISRNAQISCACALVCHKLNRPARFVMTMESNMQSIGKRYSTYQKYEIGVNNDGVIQYLYSNQWGNCGCSFNEPQAAMVASYMQNCYVIDSWSLNGFEVRTDIPSNTYCRASASTEAVAMVENMMEHIARITKRDSIQVRLANMNATDKSVLEVMIRHLLILADYESRKQFIETFNDQNRWKKRGISMVPMKYPITYKGQFNAIVSVCARDGSVCVTLSGIEIDQGINTKIAQITAYTLGIHLEFICVKGSNNLATPNNSPTRVDITTDTCGYATIQACNEILKRLEPIRKKMNNPTWKDLVFTAYQEGIDLCARYILIIDPTRDNLKPYNIYGVTIAEIEIDVLTGQHIIRRVDLMEDAGVSLNPKIDVGQIEGAFVMGIGYWTFEDLVYDPKTGVLTNVRIWNYNPPGAKDIPEDFRVYLRKNSINTVGIFGSKATDEAPFCMSCVIPIAIRNALNSARADAGNTDAWYRLDGPCTTERILLTSLTSKNDMVL